MGSGDGNPNATMHNPTGIQPGSCWKYSNQPWPNTTSVPGFITCWKPNATKPSEENSTALLPSIPPVVLPTAHVAENTGIPAFDSVTTTVPNVIVFGEVNDANTEGGSFPWTVVLVLAALAIIGAVGAAFMCGAFGGSEKPKKKKTQKTTRGAGMQAQEDYARAPQRGE